MDITDSCKMQNGGELMHTFIVAEIGINHNGDLELAKKLIDIASITGCDAVKFQKRTIDIAYSKEFLDSPYQSPFGTTWRDEKKALEFGQDEYDEINRYCKNKGIKWYASAWDVEAQDFLRQYHCSYNKVASAMLTHLKLLEEIAKEGKYTFIATGMSTFKEIDQAISIFKDYKCPFELMHCNSTYPMLYMDANLLVMDALKERYQCKVGYSGHETGTLVSTCAVAMGATSIERHITMDAKMYGAEQKASIEPYELWKLVKDIRATELIIGDGIKIVSEAENENKKIYRTM